MRTKRNILILTLILFNILTTFSAYSETFKQYDRKDWPHWIDEDNDCQNTRTEILIRNNIGTIKWKRNKPCNVSWGEWICPYTGIHYFKASDIDIDHIIPLAWAYTHGGYAWSREQRRAFANDPLNLISVSDNINRKKSDKGPSEWRPPLKSFWPEYAKRWKAVILKYNLNLPQEDDKALNEMKTIQSR